ELGPDLLTESPPDLVLARTEPAHRLASRSHGISRGIRPSRALFDPGGLLPRRPEQFLHDEVHEANRPHALATDRSSWFTERRDRLVGLAHVIIITLVLISKARPITRRKCARRSKIFMFLDVLTSCVLGLEVVWSSEWAS